MFILAVTLCSAYADDAAQIKKALTTQTQAWLLENPKASPTDRDAKIKEIQTGALKNFNERKLLFAEFKKKGGQIKNKYIVQAVGRIVRDSYDDDRLKFDEALQKSGLTLPEYKKIKMEEIIINMMRL